MQKMKIAIYADVNMNLIDGSAIWLASIVQILTSVQTVSLTLFLKAPVENSLNLDELYEIPNLKIVTANVVKGVKYLSPSDAIGIIKDADKIEIYDAIFLRGLALCTLAADVEEFKNRLWTYFCDIPLDASKFTDNFKLNVNTIIGSSKYLMVQTPQLKAHLISNFPKAKEKVRDLPPMVPDFKGNLDLVNEQKIRIVYSGQFKKEYASVEMFEIFRLLGNEFPNVEFHVFGNKIHNPPEDPNFRLHVLHELENVPNLIWHKGLGRDEVMAQYSQMSIGWAWRSNELEDNTLEISTKLLEFSSCGVSPIMARNPINQSVFGKDYPLFANSKEDAIKILRNVLSDISSLGRIRTRVQQVTKPYTFSYIATHHISPLCAGVEHTEKKPTLGIVGHDLKFLLPITKKLSLDFDISENNWWGHKNHDVKFSEDFLLKNDVIFCEWFLGNAVWYSKNKKPNQKLIVRFHRQELETDFPNQADMDNIDLIIVVSEHTKNDAIIKFGWEKFSHKIIAIPNAINCSYFNRVKNSDAKFNIGVVGITPKMKRFDIALSILEKCLLKNNKFKLFIKGRMPNEYSWMRDRADELDFFNQQFKRIQDNQNLKKSVFFDGWGNEMADWYKKIGYILSVSDFEGTHQAVAEGGASAAIPIMRDWEGASEVYSPQWICSSVDEMAERIVKSSQDPSVFNNCSIDVLAYMNANFDVNIVAERIKSSICEVMK